MGHELPHEKDGQETSERPNNYKQFQIVELGWVDATQRVQHNNAKVAAHDGPKVA